jgi:rod shape-determining protein MreD
MSRRKGKGGWPKLLGNRMSDVGRFGIRRKKGDRLTFAKSAQERKKEKGAKSSLAPSKAKGWNWGDGFLSLFSFFGRYPQTVGYSLMAVSLFCCLLLSLTRWPGMEIAGIGPNWLLIWVVAWSLKRSPMEGAFVGGLLGLLQDGMTSPEPTHALSLAIVGWLTAKLQKQRFLQEDFISAAFVVFGMAVVSQTVMALQFSVWTNGQSLIKIWQYHQMVALSSAILSSLWAPVLYLPLTRLYRFMDADQQKRSLEMSFRGRR